MIKLYLQKTLVDCLGFAWDVADSLRDWLIDAWSDTRKDLREKVLEQVKLETDDCNLKCAELELACDAKVLRVELATKEATLSTLTKSTEKKAKLNNLIEGTK